MQEKEPRIESGVLCSNFSNALEPLYDLEQVTALLWATWSSV
jgi:hypothetical protein